MSFCTNGGRVHPVALVVLLLHPEIRKLSRHHTTRRRSRHKRVLAKILDPFMLAQKDIINQAPSAHVARRRFENCTNGIGEDGGFAKLFAISLRTLSRCRIDASAGP